MYTPQQYRQFARECLRGIETSNDPKYRDRLLEAAKVWTQAAFQMELAASPPCAAVLAAEAAFARHYPLAV